jgi:hypothetical protein
MNELTEVELQTCGARKPEQESKLSAFFAKNGRILCLTSTKLGEGLSLQAKQRSARPKKTRACLSQAPAKRGVCASLPASQPPYCQK